MIDYDKYMVQILKMIVEKKDSEISIKDFENLYSIYSGNELPIDETKLLKKVGDFIGLTPFEFYETPLGQVLGQIKFGDDRITIKEAAELLNFTVGYIQQIRPELDARKSSGTWLIKESSLKEWLVKNGKPSLKELKNERRKKDMFYEIEDEKIINVGFEGKDTYNPKV